MNIFVSFLDTSMDPPEIGNELMETNDNTIQQNDHQVIHTKGDTIVEVKEVEKVDYVGKNDSRI